MNWQSAYILYLQVFGMDSDKLEQGAAEIDESEIILEEQPIQRIQQIDVCALNDYSRRFRVSYESKAHLKKRESEEAQVFHQGVVELIGRIQPSKLTIATIADLAKALHRFYPEDDKYRLRDEAKGKRILIINKLTTEQELQVLDEVQREIEMFRRWILLRQAQLGAVLFLEDARKKYQGEELKLIYMQSYIEILQYIIPPEKCTTPINFPIISKIFKYEFKLFEDFTAKSALLEGQLDEFEGNCEEGKHIGHAQRLTIIRILRELKILTSKLSTLVELFPFACLTPKDDLFSHEVTSKRWQQLFQNDVILYKLYGEPQKIDKSFNQLRTNLNIVNAAMNIFNQAKINPKGLKYWNAQLESIKKVLHCTVSSSVAHHEAEVMISEPSEGLAKEIWNLPEKKQLKALIQLTLPSIAFSQHLYIPRKLRDYFFQRAKHEYLPLPDYKIDNLKAYYNELHVQREHQQKLSVRINYSFELQLRQFEQKEEQAGNFFQRHLSIMNKNFKNNIQTIKNVFRKKTDPPKTVIFHIHGGGFISMSSFIHQSYTRKWANALNVPIISVDYGKAPEYPFPEGLYDCLEAYIWMLNCFAQLYHAEPQRIILVGDSAGGNLVGSLTNLLIQWGLRVPDGIVLVYPALNLNLFDFTPSLLTALNDMILPHTFLKICLKSYLRDPSYQPGVNYFISPIKATPAIFSQYPPTRIFVGSKDPFHDDCCRLAEILQNHIPGKVKLVIFEEFPHGFLQFDMKNSPHYYCQQATKEVEKALGQLITS